jgi:hypothetical protein
MEYNNTFGVANYNALNIKYVKQTSYGLNLLVAYSWAKQISNVNAQDAAIGNTNQSTTPQDWGNLKAERSVSELDVPQNLVVSGNIPLPFGTGRTWFSQKSIANVILGGWTFNPIWTEQTGFPLDMSVATSWLATRPGNRSNAQRVAEWLNTAAFTTPPAYTYGTERRTTTDVRKPGLQNVDASLMKSVDIEGKLQAQFRVDMFNVANSPHFAPPGMVPTTPASYGIITSVLTSPPEREIQFSLKILF